MAEKFVLMSSLEPLETGDSFEDWPLHTTIIPWFRLPKEFQRGFENSLMNQMQTVRPIDVVGDEEALFEPERSVRVRTLRNVGRLASLHNQMVDTVTRFGGEIDSPYIREYYRPHVTFQGDNGIDFDERRTLSGMQLIKGDESGPRTVERVFNFTKDQ